MGKSCELFLDHNTEVVEYWNNLQFFRMAEFSITILSLSVYVWKNQPVVIRSRTESTF